MIVRNEAGFLPDCLRSVAPVVDEIVIADTGSDDGSDAIAREFGAEVFSLPWCGDFAAARNAVLDRARGAWMLYIDADERLDPIDAAALHAELDKPEMLAATVRFYPRTGFTAYREYRLFRRAEDIRFSGVIHESIRPTLRRRIAETGGHIGESALTFRHVGYDGPQTHKLDRNEALLRRRAPICIGILAPCGGIAGRWTTRSRTGARAAGSPLRPPRSIRLMRCAPSN